MSDALVSFIIYGFAQGSIYALLAMGFSLVYGVGGILNQAHGAFYVISTYIYYSLYITASRIDTALVPIGLASGIAISLLVTPLIAGLLYFALIKPLKDSHVGVVIVTFSFAFFTEQFVKIAVDSIYHNMPLLIQGSFDFFGLRVDNHYLLIIGVAILLVLLVTLFINKSKLGKSIRAVAQDSEAASLMGINVDRILAYTLMISAFLATVAAILYVPEDFVRPAVGWAVLLDSFAIVVLGGLGSLPGSVLGAFIISYARAFTNYFISPTFSALIPIMVIVLVLIIRPRGIFGKKEID